MTVCVSPSTCLHQRVVVAGVAYVVSAMSGNSLGTVRSRTARYSFLNRGEPCFRGQAVTNMQCCVV